MLGLQLECFDDRGVELSGWFLPLDYAEVRLRPPLKLLWYAAIQRAVILGDAWVSIWNTNAAHGLLLLLQFPTRSRCYRLRLGGPSRRSAGTRAGAAAGAWLGLCGARIASYRGSKLEALRLRGRGRGRGRGLRSRRLMQLRLWLLPRNLPGRRRTLPRHIVPADDVIEGRTFFRP